MSIRLPKEISDEEILAHYLFDRSFARKVIEEKKLINKDVFLPNKGGVSLQRTSYCDENMCKSLATRILPDRKFVGFFCFRKLDFLKVKSEYVKSRPEFSAEIKSTPLNENFEYILENVEEVCLDDLGNPAHANLIYLNPAIVGDESPNTAIRSFSRKLSKVCKILIDINPYPDAYLGKKILDVFG